MMIDRINQNQELADMVDDLNALKVKNDRDAESIERIFEQVGSFNKIVNLSVNNLF